MFKDLDPLVDYIRSLGVNVDLTTNGIGIEKQLNTIRKIDSVMVSLDGPEEVHDVNRGKNSFKHAMNAITLLKSNNVPVRVNSVINRQNHTSLDWLLEFSKTNALPIT